MARLVIVVGVRPHFVKLAALLPRLVRHHEVVVVHTGQHYDRELSETFFEQLGLPAADVQLNVGSGQRHHQVAEAIASIGDVLPHLAADLVLIIGDTSSSVGAAVAAAQLYVRSLHIEAGISNGDVSTPEEVNRRLIDSVAYAHLCPTQSSAARMASYPHVYVVGDVLLDMALKCLPSDQEINMLLERYGLEAGNYMLTTSHRQSNLRSRERCENIVAALSATNLKVVFSLHPGTRLALERYGLLDQLKACRNLLIREPLPYVTMLALEKHARVVASDSNGVQRECYFLGTPCVVMRPNTEYPETVEGGGALVIDPINLPELLEAINHPSSFTPNLELFGGGRAGERIATVVDELCT